mmetsp:Transcript_6574/g.11573  ORF Transcript_6574/g.11573 Transcript_6574/m.11573 type:complete len:110 (+) Transcript_6574:293-622(+)
MFRVALRPSLSPPAVLLEGMPVRIHPSRFCDVFGPMMPTLMNPAPCDALGSAARSSFLNSFTSIRGRLRCCCCCCCCAPFVPFMTFDPRLDSDVDDDDDDDDDNDDDGE